MTIACVVAAPSDAESDQRSLVKAPPAAIKITQNGQKALFELVAELAAKRPFRVASLVALLARPFVEDRAASNPYFTVHRTVRQKQGIVLEAELRVSRGALKAGPVDGFLSLEVSPHPCIRTEDVERRFGDHFEFFPPSAHGSQQTPTYLGYRQTWGDLSFGFSRGKPACLVEVVFDAVKSAETEGP